MRRIFHVAAMFLALGALTLPSTLLLLTPDQTISTDAPAPCHQQRRAPTAPMGSHHDCCLVGHNHSLSGHVADVQPTWALTELVPPTALPSLSWARPEPALSSFDPPLITILPLRI